MEDLRPLKLELFKRLEYGDGDEEKAEYESTINAIKSKYGNEENILRLPPNETSKLNGELVELENNKARAIRKKLNDDEGFKVLESQLDNVNNQIDIKKRKLNKLFAPNLSRSLYGKVFGSKDVDRNIENIRNEIYDLKGIKRDIEFLIPIYKEPQEGGVKIKTRRNRNSNKSRKNRRKSKRKRRSKIKSK